MKLLCAIKQRALLRLLAIAGLFVTAVSYDAVSAQPLGTPCGPFGCAQAAPSPWETDSTVVCRAHLQTPNEFDAEILPRRATCQDAERNSKSIRRQLLGGEDVPGAFDSLRARLGEYEARISSCRSELKSAVTRARAEGSLLETDLEKLLPTYRTPEENTSFEKRKLECLSKHSATLDSRRQRAGSRPINEIKAIPVQHRLDEEKNRLAAHASLIQERSRDKAWAVPVLSAGICYAKEKKSDFVREIREAKRYARKYGGVVSRRDLYELQEEIRYLDGVVKESKRLVRDLHSRPLPCKRGLIKTLTGCLSFGPYGSNQTAASRQGCQSADTADYLEISHVMPYQ